VVCDRGAHADANFVESIDTSLPPNSTNGNFKGDFISSGSIENTLNLKNWQKLWKNFRKPYMLLAYRII